MIRKIFAGLFLLVFLLFSVPIALSYGVFKTVSDKDFYQEDVVEFVYTLLENEGSGVLENVGIKHIDEENFKGMLNEIIPRETLDEVAAKTYDQVSQMRLSEDGHVVISVPMMWLKSTLDEFADKTAVYLFANMETCADFEKVYLDKVDCLPEGLSFDELKLRVRRILNREIFEKLPEEYVLDFYVPESEAVEGMKFFDFYERLSRQIFLAAGIVMVILLFLVGVFVFKPVRSIVKWESLTLFLASLFLAMILVALDFVIPRFFESIIMATNSDILLDYAESIRLAYVLLVDSLSDNLYLIVFPVLGVSLIIFAITLVYDRD